MGHGELVDSMINDGLWCSFEQWHMGNAGEVVAEHYHVARAAQDAFAARSHQKAARATDAGWFKDEILPVAIPQKKGEPTLVTRDEAIRPDTTAEALAALKPAFRKDGTVTAGNAPGVNDGASALVVMAEERARSLGLTPLARIVGQATSGLPPKFVLMTPVEAVRRLVAKIGWNLADVDLFELNEAFSVQAVAVLNELGIPEEQGQRPRRRRRPRPRHRLERRARPHDPALRDETPQREARHRHALSGRRQRRRPRGGASVRTSTQSTLRPQRFVLEA